MGKYINPKSFLKPKSVNGKVELGNYQNSLKVHNDLVNTLDFAEEKGEMKKAFKIAKSMKEKGYVISEIAEITDLTIDEIEKL